MAGGDVVAYTHRVATAIRLDGLSGQPRLARFAAMPVDWWLIRADPPGAPAASDRTVARVTSRLTASGDAPSGAWVARIEGDRGAMQYAVAVIPGAVQQLGIGRRASHRVLVGLDDLQARSLLDAAETVPVSVALLRTGTREAPVLGEALASDAVIPASIPCAAAVIKQAGAGWSVVGTRPGTLPPSVSGLYIHEDGTDGVPAQPDTGSDHPRGRFAVRRVALSGAALIVVLAATAGIWRLEHSTSAALPARADFPGAAAQSCGVWTTETAGTPSTSGGAAIAQDVSEAGNPVVLFGGTGNEFEDVALVRVGPALGPGATLAVASRA